MLITYQCLLLIGHGVIYLTQRQKYHWRHISKNGVMQPRDDPGYLNLEVWLYFLSSCVCSKLRVYAIDNNITISFVNGTSVIKHFVEIPRVEFVYWCFSLPYQFSTSQNLSSILPPRWCFVNLDSSLWRRTQDIKCSNSCYFTTSTTYADVNRHIRPWTYSTFIS